MNKYNCVKNEIPFEIELTAINGMKYRDTVKWCLCVNCDTEAEERFHDDTGEMEEIFEESQK